MGLEATTPAKHKDKNRPRKSFDFDTESERVK